MAKSRMRRPKTTGTVTQNASGTWRARLHAPEGTRVSLGSFHTKREAECALAAAVGEQIKGSWVNPQAGRILFRVHATDWVDQRVGLKPRTRELYESQLRVHLLPAFGEMSLGQILPMHIRRWYSTMERNDRPGPVTRAKLYRLLKSILKTAVDDNLIVKNPCTIDGAGAERSPERPVATVEQVDELADAIDGRYRALVYLATYATLRYGELFALRRRNIDLERREVTVVEEVVQLASGDTLLGPPKSDAGRRIVSLPRSIVPEIQQHLEKFVPDDPDAFVFRGEKSALPNRSNWNKMWRTVTAQVGVDELHFHDLRHTGNTLSASTGASTKELMARMGHASSRAALIYQHASRERDQAIADGLDAILTSRSRNSRPEG